MNKTQLLRQIRIDYNHKALVDANNNIRQRLDTVLRGDNGSKDTLRFRVYLNKGLSTWAVKTLIDDILNDKYELIIVAYLGRNVGRGKTGNPYIDFTIYRDYYNVPWFERWFNPRSQVWRKL